MASSLFLIPQTATAAASGIGWRLACPVANWRRRHFSPVAAAIGAFAIGLLAVMRARFRELAAN